jgi:hypothetical protein
MEKKLGYTFSARILNLDSLELVPNLESKMKESKKKKISNFAELKQQEEFGTIIIPRSFVFQFILISCRAHKRQTRQKKSDAPRGRVETFLIST